MSLVVVGLSHHTSSVELRERLAFTAQTLPGALLELRKRLDKAGVVILSTCNRVEVYAHHAAMPEKEVCQKIRAFLADWHHLAEEEFRAALYEQEGAEVVGHLFRVASSLDSMVVGETQILGQVHDAYLASQSEQAADKVIHSLFQKAFSVAKSVRSQSSIGEGKVSVSSVAVDLAVSIFMELANKTVMVVGSGEVGELTLKSLVSRGVRNVLVVNRSAERAKALADAYNGEAVAFADLQECLHRADIVLTSTAAPGFILHAPDFERALRLRSQEPVFVIDIAVPRDVDPASAELDNVYLYNVDDLEQVVNEHIVARRKEIEQCMAMVERSVEQFARWLYSLAADPTIASMAKELDTIRERELEKTLVALPDLTEKEREDVRYLTQRIVKNILQNPMTQLKQEIRHHDPHTVIHLVKRLFGLKDT